MASQNDGLDQFRKWLVPLLMTIIGVLGGILGSDIRAKQEKATNEIAELKLLITKEVTVTTKDVETAKAGVAENKTSISALRNEFEQHVMLNTDNLLNDTRKRLKFKF
jgi:hypothetical protein